MPHGPHEFGVLSRVPPECASRIFASRVGSNRPAPVTHLDSDRSQPSRADPWHLRAPENRWFQAVSMGPSGQFWWLPRGSNPWLARDLGASAEHLVGGHRPANQISWLLANPRTVLTVPAHLFKQTISSTRTELDPATRSSRPAPACEPRPSWPPSRSSELASADRTDGSVGNTGPQNGLLPRTPRTDTGCRSCGSLDLSSSLCWSDWC